MRFPWKKNTVASFTSATVVPVDSQSIGVLVQAGLARSSPAMIEVGRSPAETTSNP
jgi:hypothetical protein